MKYIFTWQIVFVQVAQLVEVALPVEVTGSIPR